MAAAADAILTLNDLKTGERFEFELSEVVPGRRLKAKRRAELYVEVLEPKRVRLTGKSLTAQLVERRLPAPFGHGRVAIFLLKATDPKSTSGCGQTTEPT